MQKHITVIWGQTQQISTFDSYAICGACALMSDIHHTFQDIKNVMHWSFPEQQRAISNMM